MHNRKISVIVESKGRLISGDEFSSPESRLWEGVFG